MKPKGIQPTAFDHYLFIEYLARRDSWAAPHFIGSLAQLAEQVAVNHRVTGSIPVGSVWMDKPFCNFSFVWVPALAGALFLSTYCGKCVDKYKVLIGGSPGYLFSFTKTDESR